MRPFRYDVIRLIEGVRDRPSLWNRTLESYKDRTERRESWEGVFRLLDESYDVKSKEEQRITGEQVINKWTNVRDTFIKSLKTKMGKPKKKYMYHEYLKFLIDVSHVHDDTYVEPTRPDVEEPHQYNLKTESDSSEETGYTVKRPRRVTNEDVKRTKYEKSEELAEVDVYNDPRIMNEDEAFFASLLPSVVNYSEDERLEFRIEVLAVMKRIKEKRTVAIF